MASRDPEQRKIIASNAAKVLGIMKRERLTKEYNSNPNYCLLESCGEQS